MAISAMKPTVVVIRYQSLPDEADTARKALRALITTVMAKEPDCGDITMLQDSDDPTRFTLVERWSSRAAYLGPHMQQPHLQAFIRSAGAFIAGPPEISFWSEVPEN